MFVRRVGRSAHHGQHSLSWHTYIRGPWVQYPIWMNEIPSLQWQCITRICRYQVWLGCELHLTWFMYSIYTCRVLHNNQVPNFLRAYCCNTFRCYWHRSTLSVIYEKGKAVPLQAWSVPEGSRKLRFPDFMTTAQDGGKVVSLTQRPPLLPRKYTWYSFLLQGHSATGRIMSLKNSNDTIGNRTRDLPVCSVVP
jgi:hypothetical protein